MPTYYHAQNAENLAAGFEGTDQAWLPLWAPVATLPQVLRLQNVASLVVQGSPESIGIHKVSA